MSCTDCYFPTMFCLYITLRQHCFRLRNVDEVGLLMFWKWSFSPRSPCLRSPLWQQVLRRGHSPTGSGGLGRGNRLQSACRCVVLEVSRARWSCRPPADPEAQRSSDSRLSHSQLFKQRTSAISMWPTVAWRTDTNCTHTSNDPRLRHTHTQTQYTQTRIKWFTRTTERNIWAVVLCRNWDIFSNYSTRGSTKRLPGLE